LSPLTRQLVPFSKIFPLYTSPPSSALCAIYI
jgi:hypothetical protein